MRLILRGLLDRLRGRPRKSSWIEGLSREQRRLLAENLRNMVESKRAVERRINQTSPRP